MLLTCAPEHAHWRHAGACVAQVCELLAKSAWRQAKDLMKQATPSNKAGDCGWWLCLGLPAVVCLQQPQQQQQQQGQW